MSDSRKTTLASFRSRLVLGFLIYAGAVVLGVLYTSTVAVRIARDEFHVRVLALTRTLAAAVESEITQSSANLIQIRNLLDNGVKNQSLEHYLDAAVRFDANCDVLLVTNASGIVTQAVPQALDARNQDLSNQPFYQEAKSRKTPYLSNSFISLQTQAPTVTLAAGWSQGTVVMHVSLRTLSTLCAQVFQNRSGFAAVVDRHGTVIGHNHMEAAIRSDNLKGLPIVRDARTAQTVQDKFNGQTGCVGVVPLGDSGWQAVIFQEERDFFSPFQVVRGHILVLIGLVMVGLGAALYLMRRNLLRPIQELTKQADLLAGGNYELVIDPGYREMASLTHSFTRMADKIREREAALRESSNKLTQAVTGAGLGLWEWCADTGTITVNDSWYIVLGYVPGEFVLDRATFRNIMHPEDLPVVQREIRACFEDPARQLSLDARIRDKSGTWRWTLARGRVIDGGDEPRRMIGLIQDITDLKRAQAEVARSNAFLGELVDSMPSVLIGVDSNFNVTIMNKMAESATGQTRHQARGRSLDELLPQFAPFMPRVENAIRKGNSLGLDRLPMTVDSVSGIFDLRLYPLRSGGQGAVIRLDDASARVRMEEMAIQSEKMMTIGGLAAGMAHEINNPLSGILGAAQNITRRLAPGLPGNERAAAGAGIDLNALAAYLESRGIYSALSGIQELGERAAAIVSNMLSFSRGTVERMIDTNLCAVLDKAISLAASDYDLKKKYDFRKIILERDYALDLGPVPCRPGEIEQVVFNLLKNAAQAFFPDKGQQTTPEPRIFIRLYRDNQDAIIEIADNGPGMDEAVRKRIFEPFFTTKELGKGTGLGLSVSYFIVSNTHRGDITVESAPGHGTRFLIRLPLIQDITQGSAGLTG